MNLPPIMSSSLLTIQDSFRTTQQSDVGVSKMKEEKQSLSPMTVKKWNRWDDETGGNIEVSSSEKEVARRRTGGGNQCYFHYCNRLFASPFMEGSFFSLFTSYFSLIWGNKISPQKFFFFWLNSTFRPCLEVVFNVILSFFFL